MHATPCLKTALRFAAVLPALAISLLAQANGGLAAPAAEALWPQWQARVTVQTAAMQATPGPALSALGSRLGSRLGDANNTQRTVQGGAVLGDYTFARPFFGSFRASGGLMMGSLGGVPLNPASPSSQVLGLALLAGNTGSNTLASEQTLPYLGLGFTGAAWQNSLSMTADLGLVSGRPGAARALFGNQGAENALRDMRLSPVLQVGVRYSF
jgi:hypothetical protein